MCTSVSVQPQRLSIIPLLGHVPNLDRPLYTAHYKLNHFFIDHINIIYIQNAHTTLAVTCRLYKADRGDMDIMTVVDLSHMTLHNMSATYLA